MMGIDRLAVRYHGAVVGILSMTPDEKLCAFEYDKAWLTGGFSVSPLELPLRPGLFIAKSQPLYGNFGIFEDSLPDGYGRPVWQMAMAARPGIRLDAVHRRLQRTTRHIGKRNR